MTVMLLNLVIFHSLGAFNNVTTLENMVGASVNCCRENRTDQFFFVIYKEKII